MQFLSWRCCSTTIYLASILILFPACYSIDTNINYKKDWSKGLSSSNPIYLSFKDTKKAPYHFTLKHDTSNSTYLLTVYWHSPDNEQLFNSKKTSLQFLVNGEHIITLYPTKIPKTIAYDLDSKGHTEEAFFALNYDQLSAIANAKSVLVELSGRYLIVSGFFNKIHTFKAFRDFLNNAPI